MEEDASKTRESLARYRRLLKDTIDPKVIQTLQEMIEELETPMPAVLDKLRRGHANILSVLRTLDSQSQTFATAGRPDYDLMQMAVDYLLGFPESYHHPKENLVLARLAARDTKAIDAVGDLRAAHVTLAENLHEFDVTLRAIAADQEVPREALVRSVQNFTALQRHHIAMEEATFFPAAAKALNANDWNEIAATFADVADPLQSAAGAARFQALLHAIAAPGG